MKTTNYLDFLSSRKGPLYSNLLVFLRGVQCVVAGIRFCNKEVLCYIVAKRIASNCNYLVYRVEVWGCPADTVSVQARTGLNLKYRA